MPVSFRSVSSSEVQRKYNRYSRFYDQLEQHFEKQVRTYRRELFPHLRGKVLEIGVGTGKNIPYYNSKTRPIALELSDGMLRKAQNRANKSKKQISFVQADIERLPFKSNQFDVIVATFVFCSVAHPVHGLKELARVVKRTGQIILLEHVLSEHPTLRSIMKKINFIPAGLLGFSIDRETAKNIQRAGLEIIEEKNLKRDVLKRFRARA
ncbi:MAG: class I SAM-dependent methyltransferase [Candidatus Hodarchaeales archaeon]|jgi:ubiquinone/menaquinone biosynthesis C-methylase UbiE